MKIKTLLALIAITLAAATANAGDLAYIVNKNGGQIRLTDVACKDGSGDIVYAFMGSGRTLFGCWHALEEAAMVVWQDGDVYTYPISSMHLTDYGKRVLQRQKKRKAASL